MVLFKSHQANASTDGSIVVTLCLLHLDLMVGLPKKPNGSVAVLHFAAVSLCGHILTSVVTHKVCKSDDAFQTHDVRMWMLQGTLL